MKVTLGLGLFASLSLLVLALVGCSEAAPPVLVGGGAPSAFDDMQPGNEADLTGAVGDAVVEPADNVVEPADNVVEPADNVVELADNVVEPADNIAGVDLVLQDVPVDPGQPDSAPDIQEVVCGNAICEPGENSGNCPDDCGSVAGDGICEADEDCLTSPEDCGQCCGDGILQPEEGEECDDGNPEAGDGCSNQCAVEPQQVAPGDIIITEIMKDPDTIEDIIGEWFEVHNTTDQAIDMNGWELQDEGVDYHKIYDGSGVVVPAYDFLVLARHQDAEDVGGAVVDYVYSSSGSVFNLANKDDEIILVSGDTVVDAVYYDNGEEFPDSNGKTLSLDPDAFDPEANDIGSNWCDAQTPFGTGDLGTPGSPNPDCQAEP